MPIRDRYFIRILPDRYFEFFLSGKKLFSRISIFPSQVPKIYPHNGVLTRRVKIR